MPTSFVRTPLLRRRMSVAAGGPPATYISSTITQLGATGNRAFNAPPSITTGSMLLAFILVNGSGATTGAPGGWTQLDQGTANSFMNIATFWKTSTGAEPGSYTFTTTNSGLNLFGVIAQYGISGIDGHVIAANFNSAGGTPAPFTALHSTGTLVYGIGNDNSRTINTPSGSTSRNTSFSSNAVGLFDGTYSSTSVVPSAVSFSSTCDWGAGVIAIH